MPPRLARQPSGEGLQIFNVAEAAGVQGRGEDREDVRGIDVELGGEEGGRQSWGGVAVSFFSFGEERVGRGRELSSRQFSPRSFVRWHHQGYGKEHAPGEERSAERDFVVVIVVHLADVEQGRTLAVVNRQNLGRACDIEDWIVSSSFLHQAEPWGP